MSRARFTTSGGAWSRPSGARRRPSSRPTIAGARRASWPTAPETPSPPPPPRAPARWGSAPLITIAASTAAADVTGIVLASVVAALGFFIIPAKRNKAKGEMRKKVADVRARLSSALRAQFQEEIGRTTARLRDGIGPYSRFVRAEGEKLRETEARLAQLRTELDRVRQRVVALAA